MRTQTQIDAQDLQRRIQSGFTLLEIILTIGILATLTIAMTTMLKNSFDVRFGLSAQSKVTHRVGSAMFRIADDIRHSFLLSPRDPVRYPPDRSTKLAFQIKAGTEADRISFTIANHRPLLAGSPESNYAHVIYELKDSEKYPGSKDLYRAESKRLLEDLGQEPESVLFLPLVKSIKFLPWTGDGWSKDGWDSERRDHRGILPHLVKIELEVYEIDENILPGEPVNEDGPTVKLVSIIHLPYAVGMKEPKEQVSNIRWDQF